MTFDHVRPGHFVPTATMQAGGGSLDWVSDVLEPGRDTGRFDKLVAASRASVGASADGLYFLPYVLGERSPYWNPDARGCFVGLSRHHGPAELTRAVLEGVGFNLLTCIEAFRADRRRGRVRRRGRRRRGERRVAAGAGRPVGLRRPAAHASRARATAWARPSRQGSAIGSIDDFSRGRELSQVTAEFVAGRRAARGVRRAARVVHRGLRRARAVVHRRAPVAGRLDEPRSGHRHRGGHLAVVRDRRPDAAARPGGGRPERRARRRRPRCRPSSRRCCRRRWPGSPAPAPVTEPMLAASPRCASSRGTASAYDAVDVDGGHPSRCSG